MVPGEQEPGDPPRGTQFYAKPDDRWEANEVSNRCGDVTELLAVELDRFTAAARAARLSESPPLLAGLSGEKNPGLAGTY